MTNTAKRVLTSIGMAAVAAAAAHFGLIRWLAVFIAIAMYVEVIKHKAQSTKYRLYFVLYTLYFVLFAASAYFVGQDVWTMLLLFVIIAAADTGAWFFGRMIGGDKMWERLSPGKTWAGQIAGIICGTTASVVYELLCPDTDIFMGVWVGIGVSLLSQYGDLAASAIKRNLGLYDFGKSLPGHGGLMDRFDGWIFVLPAVFIIALADILEGMECL